MFTPPLQMPPFESCGAVAAARAHSHRHPPANVASITASPNIRAAADPICTAGRDWEMRRRQLAKAVRRAVHSASTISANRQVLIWSPQTFVSYMLDPLCGPLLVGSERSGWLYCPWYDHLPITEYFLKSLIAVSNLAQFMHCGKLVIIAAASYNHSWCRFAWAAD